MSSKLQFKATKLGTIGRRNAIQLFRYNKKKNQYSVNPRLSAAMKENPMSYKLPTEYIWNTETNRLNEAEDWFQDPIEDRVIRSSLDGEYNVVNGNFIEPTIVESSHQTAFNGLVNSFAGTIRGRNGFNAAKRFRPKIRKLLERHSGLKFKFAWKCKFYNAATGVFKEDWLSTKSVEIFDMKQLPGLIAAAVQDIRSKISEIEMKGSGWSFTNTVNISLDVNKYFPMRGGASYVETPRFIQLK